MKTCQPQIVNSVKVSFKNESKAYFQVTQTQASLSAKTNKPKTSPKSSQSSSP